MLKQEGGAKLERKKQRNECLSHNAFLRFWKDSF